MNKNQRRKALKYLQKDFVTAKSLAEVLGVPRKEADNIVDSLRQDNLSLVERRAGRQRFYHINVLPDTGEAYTLRTPQPSKTERVYGLTGDWHVASKFYLPRRLHNALNRLEDEGVQTVLVAGDLMDGYGVYHGHLENLVTYSVEDQVSLVAEALERHPRLMFYGITGNHDYCISMNSEIFTLDGWRGYGDITEDDVVLTLGVDGKPEFQKVIKIVFFEHNTSGMFEINGRGLQLRCTGGHRLPFWSYNTRKRRVNREDLKFTTVKERVGVGGELRVPVATCLENEEFNISDSILKIAAWVLTDGTIRRVGNYVGYSIFQSKPENIDYIRSLLETEHISFGESARTRDIDGKSVCGTLIQTALQAHTFTLHASSTNQYLRTLLPSKTLQPWMLQLSKRQFDVFLSELVRGDGSVYMERDCKIFYGTKTFLQDVQTLCHLFSYRATLKQSKRGDYRLNICGQREAHIMSKNIRAIKSDEPVWCIQVPNGNFLMRHKGSICFTGNNFTKHNGIKPLRLLQDHAKNFMCLGDLRADINDNGLNIRLIHGAGDRTYARSYPSQKYLREVFSGLEHSELQAAPHLLLMGHFHSYYITQDHGMLVVQPASFQDPNNEYCVRRGLNGPNGLVFLRLSLDKVITESTTTFLTGLKR